MCMRKNSTLFKLSEGAKKNMSVEELNKTASRAFREHWSIKRYSNCHSSPLQPSFLYQLPTRGAKLIQRGK